MTDLTKDKTKNNLANDDFQKYCQDIDFKTVVSSEEFNDYFRELINNTSPHDKKEVKKDNRESFFQQQKLNSILFDKKNLILKILMYTIDKLTSLKYTSLCKPLNWVIKVIKNETINQRQSIAIEKAKKEAKDNINAFSFMEEYSNSQNNHKASIKIYSKASNSKLEQINLSDNFNNRYITNRETKENKEVNVFNNLNKSQCKSLYSKKLDSDDEEIYLSDLSCSIDSIDNKPIAPINIISEKIIDSIHTCDFNIFKLDKETNFPMQTVANILFFKSRFYSIFEYKRMENFLSEIERGYKSNNSYHNALHAADVAQSSYVYIKYGKVEDRLNLSILDFSSLILSAIVHDYKHPGMTNNFLINSMDNLALRYNDISVLENFHISETFQLIKSDDKYNIFINFSSDEMKPFRKRMVDMVLNTDMIYHGKLLTISKSKEEIKCEDKKENFTDTKLFSLQQDYLNIILHAADISNASKSTVIYVNWAERIIEEFWKQGDEERSRKLPISFLCDRKTVSIANSQIGFIDGVVLPYFKSLSNCFNGDLDFLIQNIERNKVYYKKQKELDEMKIELE